jgi:hypothetical protein
MDPREARFLASQAERLACNKKQHRAVDDHAQESLDDCNGNSNDVGSKDSSNQFFSSFRRMCSEFRNRLDSLLLIPPTYRSTDGDAPPPVNDTPNHDVAKAYYATASRRNEGRTKLDMILRDVRSLQSHALSSSSSPFVGTIDRDRDNDDENDENQLLQSILRTPMLDVTQTDMRLMSQEIDDVLKRIDEASEIICPKEKFVFKRYRKAIEEMERSGRGGHCFARTGTAIARAEDESNAVPEDDANDRRDDPPSNYGGVLENMSNRTVEISSDGAVLVDQVGREMLRYYGAPRPADALHPPCITDGGRRQSQPATARESSSYLLRNLRNVVVLVHGSRPSLHLQHIRNCKIYASEPTLGAVHVTDCHSSEIRCCSYQLRVHDSRDVKFDVWTRSGPIIEDCTGMEFSGNYYSGGAREGGYDRGACGNGMDGAVVVPGRNMFWDVKDFNWLRALRNSPNFVVLDTSTADVDEAVCKDGPLPNTTGIVSVKERADLNTSATEEEDSEDEL